MKLLKLSSGSYLDMDKIAFVYKRRDNAINLYFIGDKEPSVFYDNDADEILERLEEMIEKQEAAAQ